MMKKYENKIVQGQFLDFYESRKDDFHLPVEDLRLSWPRRLILCHEFVKNEIDYSSESGSYIQTPSETLAKGKGDCQDQTVLLASLLLDHKSSVQIISVKKKDGSSGHVFPLARVGLTASVSADELRNAYEVVGMPWVDEISWIEHDGYPYYIADPTHSSYIGDRKDLAGKYIKETFDDWEFYRKRAETMIESETHVTITVPA